MIDLPNLTDMEQRVFREFISDGETDKIIARRIGVSPIAVHTHMSQVLRKAGVRKRAQLLIAYYRGPYEPR